MKLSRKTKYKLRKYFFNKYTLTVFFFIVFLTFFDHHNLISRVETARENYQMRKEIEYYKSEIQKNEKKMKEMMSNSESLEKYAREHYRLKRDSEDIFIIRETNEPSR